MNLFLMPLWFLSGALFPASGAMAGLRWVIRMNPLSYGLSALRQTMEWGSASAGAASGGIASFGVCMVVTIGFALVLFGLASVMATHRTGADLQ
jgi:ABC-2 type transport system permease protein